MQKGYSIIEMLVVIVVFSILTLVTTQAIFLTLRGSNKSSASIEVRENVDFAISLIERQLRNAQSIQCLNGETVNSGTDLQFSDEDGTEFRFSCNSFDNGFIASDGERLTSSGISIDCTPLGTAVFVCNKDNPPPAPDSVEINISARDVEDAGAEGSMITVSTKVLLRSY